MSEAFAWAVHYTLDAEGVFSDHSWDPGGATKYGITEGLGRRYGVEDIRSLTVSGAVEIYRREFWEGMHLEEIAEASWRVAVEIFDTAVNTGQSRATKILQEALATVFDRPLQIDGRLGPLTRRAARSVAAKYEPNLVAALNGFQFAYYLWLLRQGHPAAKNSIKGWMLRLETPYPPMAT